MFSERSIHDDGWRSFDRRDTDVSGRTLSTQQCQRMYRLRRQHEHIRVENTIERTLGFALSEIDRMGSALGVPPLVREGAKAIHRQIATRNLPGGRSIESVATVSLFAACWKENVPHTLTELAAVSRVKRTNAATTYLSIAHELDLAMQSVDPKKYVPQLCSTLDLSDTVEARANEIIDATAQDGLHTKTSSIGFAAGAISLATVRCEEIVTRAELASAAQVTTVTVGKHYRSQAAMIDSSPDEWLTDRRSDRRLDDGV